MKNIKKWLVGAFALITLISLTACQTNTTNNNDTKPNSSEEKISEEKIITATKAYVKGFIQGDKSKYDEYYGSGAFDKKIDQQLDEIYKNEADSKTPTTTEGKEIVKDMIIASKKLYAKAEVSSYTKKDDKTVSVKVKAVSVNESDIKTWSEKKRKEYTEKITNGDKAAAEAIKRIAVELFEAMSSGEIPTTLDSERTLELEFSEKDGKYEVQNEDFITITSYFYNQK